MQRTLYLLFALFILVSFQLSLANTNGDNASPEQHHSTPENTWSIFKTSILEGDFISAQKCCCDGKTRDVLKFEKMDAEKRKKIIMSMQGLQKIDQQDNKAKYKLFRNSNGVNMFTYVYFEKIGNEWKIDNF